MENIHCANRMKTDVLQIRIDPELKKRVKAYCDKKTTVTDLITEYFKKLTKYKN